MVSPLLMKEEGDEVKGRGLTMPVIIDNRYHVVQRRLSAPAQTTIQF